MRSFVSFLVSRLRESFITLQALIGLHPRVCSLVYCEILECCEVLVRLLAGEVHAGRWLGADWGNEERLPKVINYKQ